MNLHKPSSDRVAQALDLCRSIAACHDCLARSGDAHAPSAALMLPCYQTQFGRLVLQLTQGEEAELASALLRMANRERAGQAAATAPPSW